MRLDVAHVKWKLPQHTSEAGPCITGHEWMMMEYIFLVTLVCTQQICTAVEGTWDASRASRLNAHVMSGMKTIIKW